jgi:hypothetical protein
MSGKLIYLDTEFNGHGGELISMAMVTTDGRYFYEAVNIASGITPWVNDNVIPKLEIWPRTKAEFRVYFLSFLSQFNDPIIVCDYAADLIHFCQVLCGDEYDASSDYQFRGRVVKTPPEGIGHNPNPHNALSDAGTLMRWYENQGE